MTRMRTGKQTKLTQEQKLIFKAEKEKEREKFESQNMGKYKLLYPLSSKVKQNIKKAQLEMAEFNRMKDVLPDQEPLHDPAIDTPAQNQVSASKSQSADQNTGKSKIAKKKSIKEIDDEGDIYMKYLRKAAMIWEDFTTGKKKEDSSDGTNKKNVVKKTKSINPKTKACDNTQLKPKPVVQKANSAAVSHSNSIKKKYKKTVVNIDDEKEEPKRIIITSKTKSTNQEAHSSKIIQDGDDKSKQF